MDPLEVLAKHRRLERKHRRVEKELADLKAAVAKKPSETPPPPAFFSPPPKPAHGRRIFVGGVGTCLNTGTPFSSPASSELPPLPPSPLDIWVAIEASRARHEKAESKRAKQEDRTRLKSVLSACNWRKETADPELLRAAKGLWIGTETQGNADRDRAWGQETRYYPEAGACCAAHVPVCSLCVRVCMYVLYYACMCM